MSKIDYSYFDKLTADVSSDEEDKNKAVVRYKIDWNQTRKTIHIQITLQRGEGKKDNVEVVYRGQYLFVNLKTARKPIIEGPTFEKIRPANCNWWLEGDKLFLELEKALEGVHWTEVIDKDGIKSNVVDEEEKKKKEREETKKEEKKKENVAEGLVKAKGKSSYPPREKHRPYKDNKDDLFLFQVD